MVTYLEHSREKRDIDDGTSGLISHIAQRHVQGSFPHLG
jgi:hypothetical protein